MVRLYDPYSWRRYNRYGYRSRNPYNYYSSWGSNNYYYGGSRRRSRPYYWEYDSGRWYRRNTSVERDTEPAIRPDPSDRPEPPKEELVKVLKVEKIDLLIPENTKDHHTDSYDCTNEQTPPELVVRRGQSFRVAITFDRPYVKEKNDAVIVFKKGETPLPTKGTLVTIEVDETGRKLFKDDEWGASLDSKKDNSITVKISIPGNCIIGEWNLVVQSFSEGKDNEGNKKRLSFNYEYPEDITILFNPWSKADTVYMEDKDKLNEYILNDRGCYYYGSAWGIGAGPWVFGQFEQGILETALYIVRKGFHDMETKNMSNAVNVSRVISKMVNAPNDYGVLVGNWSGDYEGGESPLKWKSSITILKQYWDGKEPHPVKFGQCWVFSCLVTTVCRALGIPCRCITNFNSAHDTDESNTIEKFFRNGKPVDGISGDSVWNFHCWNEVWLARPDLEERAFDGWQVIDATPQETSEGVFQCGPCPVEAVKRGMCNTSYDASFIFSEVNADEVHYLLEENSYRTFKLKGLDKKVIGMEISTKKPDGEPLLPWDRTLCRLDVTSGYKFPEGSAEERKAVAMAQKTAVRPSSAYEELEEIRDVDFEIIHGNDVMVGSPLEITVTAKNKGPIERTVSQLELTIFPQKYTGEPVGKVLLDRDFGSFTIKPRKEERFTVTINEGDYLPYLVEQMNFCFELLWTVDKDKVSGRAGQFNTKVHQFRFRRPDLDIQVPDRAIVGKPVKMTISFKNPLSVPLTECDLSYESTGFEDERNLKQKSVPPKTEFKAVIEAVPKKKGNRTIVCTFDCKEIPDISGTANIKVVPK